MKILLIHNYYKLSGGEDKVFEAEKNLLIQNGHEVFTYTRSNLEIDEYSTSQKIKLISNTTFSKKTYNEVSRLLKKHRPDICHVHNFLPLVSPSVFHACKNNKIPTVLTLHNYRLMCTNGLLFRDGHICEECISKSAYHSVLKKCYRNSHLQTYAVARMLEKNKEVWFNQIDRFFCLTQFAKQKFVEHGLSEDKITVKPNFVDESEQINKMDLSANNKENFLLYVGRLEFNKGIRLLKKISQLVNKEIIVIGEGPMESQLCNLKNITLLGKKSRKETLKVMQQAKALILPSISYEGGLPLTALEAFACKTPVIATKIGSMKSMIKHRETGFLFEPNSQSSFNNCIKDIYENQGLVDSITKNADTFLKTVFTKEYTYNKLIESYSETIRGSS